MTDPHPAYNGDEPYIFVCYSHQDKEIVYTEIRRMQDAGVCIWYDEGVSPGEVFTDELSNAIEGCSTLLYFVSASSVSSRYCQNEIQFAASRDKKIVPVYLEDTKLTGGLELMLGLSQAIPKYSLAPAEYDRKLQVALRFETALKAAATQKQTSWIAPVALAGVVAAIGVFVYLGQPQETVQPPPDEQEIAVTAAHQPNSIAVLPFANLNEEADIYFSDGITDDIIHGLASNRALTVKARTSSFAFRGQDTDLDAVAERLDITHAVEGSVRQAGNKVRVTAQLVEVASGNMLWSERYDRDLTDIFLVQDDITSNILLALNIHLTSNIPLARTEVPAAYQAYLRGRHMIHMAQFEQAREFFDEAIRLDPTYGDPYAQIAHLYDGLNFMSFNFTPVPRQQSRIFTEKALTLDPGSVPARTTHAMNMLYGDLAIQEAADELGELCSNHPNDVDVLLACAMVFLVVDQAENAIQLVNRAIEVDPLSPGSYGIRAHMQLTLGNYEAAKRDALQGSELSGQPPAFQLATLASRAADTESLAAILPNLPPIKPRLILDAIQAHLLDDQESLGPLLQQMEGNPAFDFPYEQLVIALVQDDFSRAVEVLDEAVAMGMITGINLLSQDLNMEVWPEFTRSDQYRALKEKYGLDAESLAAHDLTRLTSAMEAIRSAARQ